MKGQTLEAVQTVCYLGFDIKDIGTISGAIDERRECNSFAYGGAINTYDKACKAMRPLITSISSIVKSLIKFVINCACVNYVNNFPIFIEGEYSFQISHTFVIKV